MVDLLITGLQFIIDGFGNICKATVNLLPTSPFVSVTLDNIAFIDTLNWVMPFRVFITILMAWLTAIGLYLVVQIILRWVKVIA